MQSNWKLLLSILMGLVIIGCASPAPPSAGKIYFDLKSDPSVLVNELGVDITLDKESLCYALSGEQENISAWAPVILFGGIRVGTPFPNEGKTDIRSGSSVPNIGVCQHSIDKWKGLHMSAWMYRRSDQPNQKFAIYSDNIDPADASLHLSVTTSVLTSAPFEVKFQNTGSMTMSVPLNCLVTDGHSASTDLDLAHLERQTGVAWEAFRMGLKRCASQTNKGSVNEEWLDIAPQMSGTVDLRSAYPADFVLEKGRYRWVTTFCAEYVFPRRCFTSFSPTFDYPPEQTP